MICHGQLLIKKLVKNEKKMNGTIDKNQNRFFFSAKKNQQLKELF